ncbi:hypothetical protein K439DRAFT_1556403 [Ramaria rubella]|nr:hypothetical protein K439DRAFT_1556403 [Ramaria rubella]
MDMDYDELNRTLQNGKKVPTKSSVVAKELVNIAAPIASHASVITSAVKTLSETSILSNATQVLDKIADIGKDMPFVTPAFVLLKFIIEVEKKAQETDAKCNDLIERITFMLVVEPTRMVIERINGVLKDAAALIAAYRKQGAVARRLSIHNRDKFAASVQAINGCSKDLMMSLQIHQTTRLDILTRAVPTDSGDEAAENFVALHGSIDVIKQNPELVSKFAQEQHLKMDDGVMVQLNTNITDTMKQTAVRLEDMIKGNVSEAIIDGLRGLAAEMNIKEAQQRFTCVQCDKEFTIPTNGPKACNFHRAPGSKRYPCCGQSQPCQFQSHRAAHHCEYPYGPFFSHANAILSPDYSYITYEQWVSANDINLESRKKFIEQAASAGRLLRWEHRAPPIKEPIILIFVGNVQYDEPYYFRTFTAQDFESVTDSIRLTHQTVIYRTSASASEFAMAEWVVSSAGEISGIRLTVKAATSESPFVRVCHIDTASCTKLGDVLTLSEGGLRSYKPATPYVLPDIVRIGPEVSDVTLRDTRTDFKTRTSPALCVVLKPTSDSPLKGQGTRKEGDFFHGEVSVFNSNTVNSSTPVTISSVSALFRFVGDRNYTPIKECIILDNSQLPITIEPRQSWRLKFEVMVPRSKEDEFQYPEGNFGPAARHRPLRIKLVLEEIEGKECSIVLEYIYKRSSFRKAHDDDDTAFVYFDDPIRIARRGIRFKQKNGEVVIDGCSFQTHHLQKIVYQSLNSGETEIDLRINLVEKDSGTWTWGVWALVDIQCRRIYAFKILLKEGPLSGLMRFGCLGYVLCPDYGDIIDETRPIYYASEKVKLPDFEPYIAPEFVIDDTFDDFIPEPPKLAPEPVNSIMSGSPAPLVGSEHLDRRASIDSNLALLHSDLTRVAAALERLVDILDKKV